MLNYQRVISSARENSLACWKNRIFHRVQNSTEAWFFRMTDHFWDVFPLSIVTFCSFLANVSLASWDFSSDRHHSDPLEVSVYAGPGWCGCRAPSTVVATLCLRHLRSGPHPSLLLLFFCGCGLGPVRPSHTSHRRMMVVLFFFRIKKFDDDSVGESNKNKARTTMALKLLIPRYHSAPRDPWAKPGARLDCFLGCSASPRPLKLGRTHHSLILSMSNVISCRTSTNPGDLCWCPKKSIDSSSQTSPSFFLVPSKNPWLFLTEPSLFGSRQNFHFTSRASRAISAPKASALQKLFAHGLRVALCTEVLPWKIRKGGVQFGGRASATFFFGGGYIYIYIMYIYIYRYIWLYVYIYIWYFFKLYITNNMGISGNRWVVFHP